LTDNVKDLVEISIYMIFTIVGGVLAYKNSYFLKLLFSALIGSMFGILIFFVFESFSIIEEFMILNDLANLFLNIFAIGFGFFASFLSYKREILFDGLIGIFTVILIGAMFQIPNTYILLMSVTAFFIGIKSENFFIIIIESIIAFFTGILLSFILINTVFVNTILSKNEEMLNLIFGIIFILGVLFFNRKKQV